MLRVMARGGQHFKNHDKSKLLRAMTQFVQCVLPVLKFVADIRR
jgi:hypothetical protein